MTKYRIKFTRPEEPDTIAADGFANIKEAADALPKIITRCATVSIEPYEESGKPKDVSEMIPCYEAALKFLGSDMCMRKEIVVMPDILEQVGSFEELLAINKAWNKADNWKPRWKDSNQIKFYPIVWPESRTVSVSTEWVVKRSPFYFKTEERCRQFIKKFGEILKRAYGVK